MSSQRTVLLNEARGGGRGYRLQQMNALYRHFAFRLTESRLDNTVRVRPSATMRSRVSHSGQPRTASPPLGRSK